jgi:TIR domain/AAA ATPase domain
MAPETQPVVFISHTTRDNRDSRLAHRLAQGLKERGAGAWIAPDDIPAGDEWREDLVSGVMDRSTHFLVVLSAASTRARWVLEEIRLARERYEQRNDLRILPLPAGKLGKFANSDFLATLQQVAYHDDFHAQLESVVAAVGLRPTVPDTISTIVAEKTRDFVGRDYVFDAIERFLTDNPKGYFTIEGDPGIGKSAILATYVQRSGCVAHFNIRAEGITTARQFVENVCTQLIARFGLNYPTLPADAADSGAFLAQVLKEAAAQLETGERLVIAVDALDEADPPAAGNLLFLPRTLPDGVYFVLTRRQIPLSFTTEAPQELLDLMQYQDEGLEDAKTYIRKLAKAHPKLADWIAAQELELDAFVDRLAELSEGNFMYLRYVIPDIEKGVYERLEIDRLPIGLGGYYEDHWERMGMTAKPLPRTKIRIVYVLAEARRTVSRRLIARLASTDEEPIDELAVQEVLDEWDEFLREQSEDGTTVYSVYHASFQDFLHRREIVQAAGVTLKNINALIADNLWEDLFGTP